MLNKCANPNCSEQFRYLHQGKIFCLDPTPEWQTLLGDCSDSPPARFWLCDECCKSWTVIWDGLQAKVIPKTPGPVNEIPRNEESMWRERPRRHAGRRR